MFKVWFLIMLFFVGGVAGISGWLADLMPYYSFSFNSKTALASPASKAQQPGQSTIFLDETRYQYPLRFRTESGNEVFVGGYYTSAYVPARALEALQKEGQVKVIYLPDDPQKILFEGDVQKLPLGFGRLALGLISIAVGCVLIRKRHRLVLLGEYLGAD